MGMKFMTKKILIISFLLLFLAFVSPKTYASSVFDVRSVDTMKTSRDQTLYKENDPSFDSKIDEELNEIKQTGANYVTVDGAYDSAYIPWLKRWVDKARQKGFKIWFRGNFSGWSGWFGPQDLDRQQHLELTKNFILNNPDLFEDGDIFTACPECEYGGPGNPLSTGDIDGYRSFMIDEYNTMKDAFKQINKNVKVNYTSINPDVAKVVLDKDTVEALGNVIVLDYYVKNVDSLKYGLDYFENKFPSAKIVLGEFGAPIPDINGSMTDQQQADFIDQIMQFLKLQPEVIGVNYWVSSAGTTAILDNNLNPKPAAMVVKKYFDPGTVEGRVTDENGNGLNNIPVSLPTENKLVTTDASGGYSVELIEGQYTINFGDSKNYYVSTKTANVNSGETNTINVSLTHKNESIIDKILKFFRFK